MNVRFTKLALADVSKAAAWYEGQKEGLGDTFIDYVAEAVDAIRLNPLGYQERIKDVRMAVVQRFPFSLWFRVVDNAGLSGVSISGGIRR